MAGRNGGGTHEAYHGAVEHALAALEPFKGEIEASVQMQGPLLEQIFAENERCEIRRERRCGMRERFSSFYVPRLGASGREDWGVGDGLFAPC